MNTHQNAPPSAQIEKKREPSKPSHKTVEKMWRPQHFQLNTIYNDGARRDERVRGREG